MRQVAFENTYKLPLFHSPEFLVFGHINGSPTPPLMPDETYKLLVEYLTFKMSYTFPVITQL